MAAALSELLDDPERMEDMGRLGRKRAENLFDLDRQVGLVLGVLKEVAEEALTAIQRTSAVFVRRAAGLSTPLTLLTVPDLAYYQLSAYPGGTIRFYTGLGLPG